MFLHNVIKSRSYRVAFPIGIPLHKIARNTVELREIARKFQFTQLRASKIHWVWKPYLYNFELFNVQLQNIQITLLSENYGEYFLAQIQFF